MSQIEEAPFAAYIGIDWADEKHDICLLAHQASQSEFQVLKQSPEAIEQWALALRKRFEGQPIAICLEQSKGPLIYALLKYEFLIIYPINRKAGPAPIFSKISANFCPFSSQRRSF